MANVGVKVKSFTSFKNKNKSKKENPTEPTPDAVLACCFLCAGSTNG